jgi:splicing factor 3B subunit 1|eukprot:COSAG04_NODE_3220_length_3033_cov_1.553851_2_plen_60_part_00
MNEYRTPELNVQNGVLKSLSFLFEYIQEMGKVRASHAVATARSVRPALDTAGHRTTCTR